MILASGARGPGFNSRTSPLSFFYFCCLNIHNNYLYSNSFISPNSAEDLDLHTQTSKIIQPTKVSSSLKEQTNKDTLESSSRVARSAEPIISKTFAGENLLFFKNIEESLDGNGVELSGRHYIQPSTTDKDSDFTEVQFTSGEVRGALQGRSLQEPQEIKPTATMTASAMSNERPRQANPDIQDIITGIVKLLNGNVNVQANTAPGVGRPLRPLSTRINNRGPPRITDVPALPPDFDIPAPPLPPPPASPMSTRAPYPFDLPPNMSPKRPYISNSNGIYRPVTIPPWNRRRPTKHPNVPPYRPMPPMSNSDLISFTSEKPNEDILTLNLGGQFEDHEHDETKVEGISENVPSEATTDVLLETSEGHIDLEIMEFEKNKEKKPDKSPKITVITPTLKTDLPILATEISLVTEEFSSTIASTNLTMLLESSTTNATLASSSSTLELESSIHEEPLTSVTSSSPTPTSSSLAASSNLTLEENSSASFAYRPRPGIVLDDTEYKPGAVNNRPIITRPPLSAIGDIFDVTVSAIQGPGGDASSGQPLVIPVDLQTDVITSPTGSEGFVSIDGKRTYLNLFNDSPEVSTTSVGVKPSAPNNNQVVQGTSYVDHQVKPNYGQVKPQRRPFGRPSRPSQPPVRIDTCIVGDDSTCDVSQHEICKTESGVSACHCRPGTARRKHRDPCRKIVSVLMSLRVDKIYERRIVWADELLEKTSDSYGQLSYEAERALESAMSMTPFSDEYLGAKVNNIYQGDRSQGQAGVFINITLQLEENADTSRPSVRGDIQKQLLGVIQRRSNNVGSSALWVDSPPGAVSGLQDLDECSSPDLHDCHAHAECINIFGSFKCECREGFRDPWSDNKHRAGRSCEQCPASHCNNRGECKYLSGQEVCTCSGNYYGSQCELDGEVLGVAIGASVAAIIIIGLTLVCLVMWSRKWSREQKAAQVGSPVFGYMNTAVKTPVVATQPYQLTLEDRLRWAQIADVMAQANHYAPEPGLAPSGTRPSSAMFGYPTLPIHPHHAGSVYGSTLPPVPLPRLNLQAQMKAASVQSMRHLENNSSSSSEEEDKVDLLGRNFQVPRPKSRSNASVANQSGIYYDVDYDQNDPNVAYKPSGIPLKVLSGLNDCKLLSKKDKDDFWLYDDFLSDKRTITKSPTTCL
ncbi:hypothetical protein ABEB36_006557 [Hypothenemus hampei]|uniref:EGF-like domain-containing protein n=1 Tax=Hypothenemus hampei TaxID=57062 RepID=A0ABD1ET61_HYPHA